MNVFAVFFGVLLSLYCALASSAVCRAQQAAAQSWFDEYVAARKAYRAKDFAEYLKRSEAAERLASNHPELLRELAAACALAGDTSRALATLARLTAMGAPFNPVSDADFTALKNLPRFRSLVRSFDSLNARGRFTDTAFVLQDKELIPEGIAYDPRDRAFYVGSIAKRKIVRIDAKGNASDFAAAPRDSLWDILGMSVDAKRRALWVCSPTSERDGALKGASAILRYDLATKTLQKRYALSGAQEQHLFNDIVVAPNGDAYCTDSEAGRVYVIRAQTDALTPLTPAAAFEYPNGVALSPDASTLFVADFHGVWLVSTSTGARQKLRHPETMTLCGLDGLYFYDGDGKPSLVGVQNGMGTGRIIRAALNSKLDAAENLRTLEAGHPAFIIPTTGAVANGALYAIANSQLRAYQAATNSFPEPEKLRPIIILKVPLR